MRRIWLLLALIAALAVATVILTGCSDGDKEETTGPEAQAPDLPPQSSFIMPMGQFDTAGHTLKAEPVGQQALTVQNWFHAAVNVVGWSAAVGFTMAVPTASFVASFGATPSYQGDGWWAWSYNFTALSANYSAKLKGRIVADSVEWQMYITKQGTYTDFLWYSGANDIPATGGWWILKREPTTPVDWLRIDWSRDTTNSTAEISYMIVESGAVNEGSYIHYGTTVGGDYDRFYTIHSEEFVPDLPRTINIEWNSVDENGRVQDANYFYDTLWHCWNDSLQDIDCP